MGICEDILGKGYKVYYDNFFSSVSLAADLQNGTTSVATTQYDRTGFPKDLKKSSVAGCTRGMTHSITLDDKVHCFVWLDAKPVFFIDTELGCTVPTTVARSLRDGSSVSVPCPPAVVAYNQSMGGVDLADQTLRFHTCTHKSSRRWYLRLFWFALDLAIDNAYTLECCFAPVNDRRTIKSFREELATKLLCQHSSRQHGGRQSQALPPQSPARLEERHFIENLGTDSDCAVCSDRKTQRKRTKYGCVNCGMVHLCLENCFKIYHTKENYK